MAGARCQRAVKAPADVNDTQRRRLGVMADRGIAAPHISEERHRACGANCAVDAMRPQVLVAAPSDVIRQITPALEDLDVLPAVTWDDALAHLRRQSPDGLIVSYSFDELRPFRLLHHLLDEGRHVPTILLRAVPVRLERTEESDIRQTYSALGVAEFFNFADVERGSGRAEALQQLRRLVMNHLGLYPNG